MRPDEEALRRDLQAPAFRLGERRGKWRLKGIWLAQGPSGSDQIVPYALFFVAVPQRALGPQGFLLRSECVGYSGIAPTSQLWHGANDAPLEPAYRPHNGPNLMVPFSTWGQCLYHPVDRLARDHWPDKFADQKWTPDKTITFLLETVYGLFHSPDYTHADLPAAALDVPSAAMG
jgi:hypothetical protein